jgi:gamma-glutamylputrescine oxidase
MISFWERNSFTQADIIIIGAGITGLSTACSIKEKYPTKRVIVLERGIFPTDMKLTDTDSVAKLALTRKQGLDKLRGRLGDNTIGYIQNGGYELVFDNDKTFEHDKIEELNQTLLPYFGAKVFDFKDELIPAFGFANTKHLIYTPFEGQIDTGMMMQGLARYATGLDVKIIYGAEMIEFDEDETGISVLVNHRQLNENVVFKCDKIALCTNAFTGDFIPELDIKPGRGQVLVTKPIEGLKFKGTFHFEEGYFYFRDYGNRVLFGGGRNLDFDTEHTTVFEENDYILNELKDLLDEVILPGVDYEIDTNWQGIMGFSADKKPIVKMITDNIAVGFGCNGMGIAIGSHTGEQLATLLVG